jgi:hypothetical protein
MGDSNPACAPHVGGLRLPDLEKLLFHHPRILFGQKIHQRPDRRQQPRREG